MKTVTTYAVKKAKQFLNLLQGYTKGIRMTAILILLLMGVSNAWADNGAIYGVYFTYTHNGTDKNSEGTTTIDLNELTSDFQIKSVYLKVWDDWGSNKKWTDGQLCYTLDNWKTTQYHGQGKWSKSNKSGNNWELQNNSFNKTMASATSASGKYTMKYYWQVWGNGANSYLNNNGSNYTFTWTITPPAVNDFKITPSGHLSGSGTSNDPYIIPYNQSLTLELSGSKARTDANSSLQYNTSGTWNTTTSETISNITSTTTQSVTLKMRCYNSTDKLEGANSSKTIHYRAENTYTVTVTNDGHGTTDPSGAQSNVGQVTGLSIEASPATNYEFVNWTITSGSGSFGSETSASTTFKPTSAATIQANFRSTATNSLTVVAGANIKSVTGSKDPVTLGDTYAITATPKTGYTFSTWTANPAENATFGSATAANTTVTVKNGSVTVTASATEIKHDITVSYKFGSTTIKDNETISAVGEVIPTSVTAPKIDGYVFASWTLGAGIQSDNTSANPISITTTSSGPYTLTANYAEEQCVYFINTGNWSNVYIHAWKEGGEGTTWPGTKLTKTETIKGFDIYKYTLPAGKNYNKVIFHENTGDEHKTADLEWRNGKYYDFYQGKWFDRNEFEAMVSKIYFKNTLGWKNVYLYTFSTDVWVADKGVKPKNSRHDYGKMTQIENTGIFYYEISNCNFAHIAFSDADMSDYNEFYENNAVYRSEHNYRMSLFIPQIDQTPSTTNKTKYYSSGLWMKYNSTESGYNLVGGFNDWNDNADKFTAGSAGVYHFEVEMNLGASSTYEFKIKKDGINDWFGKNSPTITSTKNTDITFVSGEGNAKITTTSSGIHIFSIDLSEGKMNLSVEYPLISGDYRLVYVESEVQGTAPYTKFHPAQSIRHQAEGEKKDTISFYINKTTGKNPAILLQQCSINGATITWNDVAIQYINGNQVRNPGGAMAPAKRAGKLYIGSGCSAVEENGVYNFVLQQTNGEAAILSEETHPYTGDYYIRTNAADGGWRKYNTNPDNIMTHSQTALKQVGGYDYYFCKWVLKDQSVQYVVANDYSYCVSDTLTTDAIVTNVNGILPANANVRYTWNSSTNALARAYLSGSSDIKDRYLVLIGNEYLKDVDGNTFPVGTGDRTGLKANEVAFEDMGNWLYQLDVKANQNTLVKLTADYNKTTQYFKGSPSETEQLIKGSDDDYTLRLIYDFKTNYLVSGLVGNQTITGDLELEEVMIVRSHHEEAQTLKISNGSVTANKAYGVMTFKKTTLNDNTKSQHERALYWVSFPFDVKLDEAFGFGNYGEHWIMEYYDGEARAKNGAWVDSDTYWKYIENPKGYTLKAGKGYVLCLDLDLLGNDSEFWDHENTEIALYFPSSEANPIVINNAATQRETTVPTYTCTIERDDRNIHDSNWNIIGVPAYTKIAGMTGGGVISYYRYDASKNEYEPAMTSGFNFNTMHAYMVQYAGTINWTEQATSIAALAARKSPAGKDQYTLRLALQQEDAQCDHTFIRLQEDKATAEFDMNYDLCKIINRGANIYSMINNVEVAANVLPVEERVIPLGLDIHETGNYTFAMPDGTDGITAILIDYETGKETNLLLADYTTELREGTNNGRFALRVRPNHVATAVETIIDGANGQIQKYIINGALYILNNGQLYDAQGRMVQP